MARKVSFKESVKTPEKREFFNTKYSLKTVTGMKKIGDEAYILLLKPEEYIFQVEYHKVKEKVHGRVGFKSMYDTNILCKRFDAEGNRSEEMPLCCQLANDLFQAAKEKAKKEAIEKGLDPEVKENVKFTTPIAFTQSQIYVPIIVLGTTETETGTKPQLSKLAIKNGRAMFAYLEMNKKSYISEIYDKLKTELINNGEIDEETEGEELQEVMLEKLKSRIIRVTAAPASGNTPYERKYSFVSFENKNIAKLSGEYEDIKNFEEDEELMSRAQDFLGLFESEVDNFVKDWTEDELTKYLVEDEQRRENIKQFKDTEEKEEEEEEEEITFKETPTVKEVIDSAPISQVSEISITDEDISFDTSDDEFVDDWDEND